MPAMNFNDLTTAVANKTGLSRGDSDQAIRAFVDCLQTSVGQGDKVSVPGLGQLEIAERGAREGRSPGPARQWPSRPATR